MKLKLKNNKGFTLVELIVVIAILAILALILVPTISNYVNNANESKNQTNAKMLYSEMIMMSLDDENSNAEIQAALDALVGEDKVTISASLDEIRFVPAKGRVIVYDGSIFLFEEKSRLIQSRVLKISYGGYLFCACVNALSDVLYT